jgi:hypothetical protein
MNMANINLPLFGGQAASYMGQETGCNQWIKAAPQVRLPYFFVK